MDMDQRNRIERERREKILEYPPFTLLKIGWQTAPDRVQGQVYYRLGAGLGPTGRDLDVHDNLRRAVQGMYEGHQEWGLQVLAVAPDPEDGRWPLPRTRAMWREEVSDRWAPLLAVVERGAVVCMNESSHWTKVHDDFWQSGLNRVSTHLLLRLGDEFRVIDGEMIDETSDDVKKLFAALEAQLPPIGDGA